MECHVGWFLSFFRWYGVMKSLSVFRPCIEISLVTDCRPPDGRRTKPVTGTGPVVVGFLFGLGTQGEKFKGIDQPKIDDYAIIN